MRKSTTARKKKRFDHRSWRLARWLRHASSVCIDIQTALWAPFPKFVAEGMGNLKLPLRLGGMPGSDHSATGTANGTGSRRRPPGRLERGLHAMFHRPGGLTSALHEESGGPPDTSPYPRRKCQCGIKDKRKQEPECSGLWAPW